MILSDDDDVAVDVDVRFSPMFKATGVTDHEAGESRVLNHEGVSDCGLGLGHVDGVFEADHTVDHDVHLRAEEEAAGGGEWIVWFVWMGVH